MSDFRNAVLYAATALNREMAIGRYGAASSVQRKLFRTLQIFPYVLFVKILFFSSVRSVGFQTIHSVIGSYNDKFHICHWIVFCSSKLGHTYFTMNAIDP